MPIKHFSRSGSLAAAALAFAALSPLPATAANVLLSGTVNSAAGDKMGGVTVSAKEVDKSITTTVFTLIGLAFGARLGARYEHRAEGIAGAMLLLLAMIFFIEHLA